MNFFNHELMYEFQAKGLTQTEAIKQYTDHTVKEIKSVCGWDADVQIHIEPEAKDKHLFSVSMSVYGLGEPIIIKKEGKNVMAVLRRIRKRVLRQVYQLNKKRISNRRRSFLREQFAS
jgi:ribosome-associated translation inhibitor RaiA